MKEQREWRRGNIQRDNGWKIFRINERYKSSNSGRWMNLNRVNTTVDHQRQRTTWNNLERKKITYEEITIRLKPDVWVATLENSIIRS